MFTLVINLGEPLHWDLLILVKTLHWDLVMLLKNLTLCWWKTLHWNLLMVVSNLTLTHTGDKLYTRLTNACERWEILHRILPLLVSNLILRHAHGSDKPYDLHLLMAATNLSYGGEEPYARTYSCLWETLQRGRLVVAINVTKHIHDGEKPYIETCSCSWRTLLWDLLMLMRNLTHGLSDANENSYIISCGNLSCWWSCFSFG